MSGTLNRAIFIEKFRTNKPHSVIRKITQQGFDEVWVTRLCVVIEQQQIISCGVCGADALCSLSPHHRALLLSEHAASISRMPHFLYSAPWEYRFPSADLEAVKSHCLRTKINAQCYMNENGSGVVVERTQSSEPSVAVIIPTRGTEAEVRGKNRVLAAHAIAQLVEHSTIQNFEIIVVVDDATPATALQDIKNAAPGTSAKQGGRKFRFLIGRATVHLRAQRGQG